MKQIRISRNRDHTSMTTPYRKNHVGNVTIQILRGGVFLTVELRKQTSYKQQSTKFTDTELL